MGWTIRGRLDSTGSDGAALAECNVEVFFQQKAPAESPKPPVQPTDYGPGAAVAKAAKKKDPVAAPSAAPVSVQGRASAITDSQGKFEVTLPDRDELASKRLRFMVSAPSGHSIADDVQDVDPGKALVRISVNKVNKKDAEPIVLKASKDLPQPQSRRVTGRVIERSGKALPASLQVLLFARGHNSPVLIATADGSGYFFGETANKRYESAAATVGGVAGEIAVALEDGFIPARVVLVVELPEGAAPSPKDSDCACDGSASPPRAPSHADIENAPDTYSADLGTGRCVQFNTPNRAIEEFNFYTVVRTTEPVIRGLTVGITPPREATGTPPPIPAKGPQPASDARVSATVFKLALHTGSRGTWGQVGVTLITEDSSRFKIYSKVSVNSLGGFNPNFGTQPELQKLVFDKESITAVDITVTAPIDFDLRKLRKVEVDWTASNSGDGWSFEGIALSAKSTEGESIPVLVNDMELYIQSPEIAFWAWDLTRGTRVWSGSARIADRTPQAIATGLGSSKTTGYMGMSETIRTGERILLPPDRPPVRTPARPLGRATLDANNPVDWDSTPTFHEATTIAHGHLLHFKQVWYADGYSLGDLLYSLPLAPGQKKLISVVDWERRERTERTEATFGSEDLRAALSRDRDLGEVVTGALTESSRGGSRNTTAGIGAGTGAAGNGSYQQFNFGALVGVSGGYGESNSDAWQASARTLSTNSLQTLRDTTLQSASAVRGLRSSVVHSVSQGEAVRATTEVVANHNHCHAITVQYFEVLRHLKLVHELTDVQECLFVPMPMSQFDLPKLLRWAQPLRTYLHRADLDGGFDAARRVATGWTEVDYPQDHYADEAITSIAGELLVTLIIPLPPFPERPKAKPEDPADAAKAISEAINPTSGTLGILLGIFSLGATVVAGTITTAAIDATKAATAGARATAEDLYAQPTAQERYDKFHHEILPGVVEGFIDQLEVYALVNGNEVKLNGVDFTLVSDYQPGKPLLASLRGTIRGRIPRSDISQLIIKSPKGLPTGCRAIVNAATIRYRTRMYEHALIEDSRVNDDIDLPKVTAVFTTPFDMQVQEVAPGTGAALYTPTDEWEQRSPRIEDRRLSAQLVDHLNDNLEFYHHAIWWTMDPNRRFMLLDGYYAPGSGERSVASVVENRLIGIVGNSFVLPVARGIHLDPRFRPETTGKGPALLDFYKLSSPLPAARVSLPTRGVFAEAVMGSCNACEEIDDSKFWRWEDSPIDEPPLIEPISTTSRRTEPGPVLPSSFPTPIVSIQNAPTAPDPAGVRAALDTISRQSFADITGLAGTQANAAAAYSQALDTAFKFGKEASTLAQAAGMQKGIDRTMGSIDKAEAGGKIDANDAKQLRLSALKKMVGDESNVGVSASSANEQMKVIQDQVKQNSITAQDGRERTNAVLDTYIGGVDPNQRDRAAAASLLEQIPPRQVTKVQTQQGLIINASAPTFDPSLAARQPDAYRWQDLISFRPSKDLLDALGARGLEWQRIANGIDDVNLDKYELVIRRLPNKPGTNVRFKEKAFFEYVRTEFASFLPEFFAQKHFHLTHGSSASYVPYKTVDADIWASSQPLGAVMVFQMGAFVVPEWGVVQCAEYVSDDAAGDWHWNFVTVNAGLGLNGYHPVSGTRQFGLSKKGDSLSFYIRAADRAGTTFEEYGEFWFEAVFKGGDDFWMAFFANLAARINSNGGTAEFSALWHDSRRHPWAEVERYQTISSPPGLSVYGPGPHA